MCVFCFYTREFTRTIKEESYPFRNLRTLENFPFCGFIFSSGINWLGLMFSNERNQWNEWFGSWGKVSIK